jgi:hypothetical protein
VYDVVIAILGQFLYQKWGKISKILRGGICRVGDTFPKVSNFWKGIFLQISFHNAEKTKALATTAKALFFKKGNKRKERGTCLYQLGYSLFYQQGGTRTRNTFLHIQLCC